MSLSISQEYLNKLQKTREIEGIYLANSLQQGFIYHALNQGNIDDAYIVQLIWQYNNQINVNKLKEAWNYAQKRYPTLRTRFAWEEQLIQVVDKEGNLDWRYIDLSKELNSQTQELKIRGIQEADRHEPYKLEQGSLFRVYIIKQKEDVYTCILSNHHAIMDGWSVPILLEFVHGIYLKLLANEKISLSMDYSYKDIQKYLQKHREVNQNYWGEYVSQIEERTDLQSLCNTSAQIRISEYKLVKEPKTQTLTIQGRLYDGLKELGKIEGITLNAIVQYIWHKTLSIFDNNKKTVVGVTVSGRNLPINNIENSVGLYINTLPFVVNHQIHKTKSMVELIKVIQNDINEINARSIVNLASLQKNGERLFDSLFIYENYPNPTNEEQQNKLKISFKNAIEKLDYPLVVMPYETDNKLIIKITYAGELFSKDTIKYLFIIIKTLLEQITINPSQKVQNINYIDQEEHNRIVNKWNSTEKEYPRDKMIHELFEEQVRRTPDNVAIISNDVRLTYKELNERSNQLAHYLRESYGIREDRLVALCLDRNEHMLIAIFSVLKAGGAYVPLDPSYPEERIKYILGDTATNIVLTNEVHKERLESIVKGLAGSKEERTKGIDSIVALKTKVLAIDGKEIGKQLLNQLITNPAIKPQSTNLAYVIYTSGTTGKPKGVMIEHKAYIATIDYVRGYYFAKDKGIKTYSITNYVFDIFGLEYGVSLLSGGSISIGNNEFNFLDCTEYDFVQMTPSICDLKLDCFANTMNTKLFVGGESLSSDLLNRILSKSINIVNVYGPTETTIWSASKLYEAVGGKDIRKVSLGKPFGNEKVYVLDENLVPLPVGAIGELYIGGEGLARGYWGKHGLTAERFIANPFQTEEEKLENRNGRIYKTGDLVRWLESVELEYIGRNDFQVKVRGHRIELGEIEEVLSSYEGVKQSVVVIKEHNNIDKEGKGNKYVIGYYVSEEKLDEERILGYMRGKLPEYMIPSVLVHLERLPLTVNGKLDRQALPDAEFISVESYVAPRNELEKKLCQIWGEVLGLGKEKVGIRDDFFRLGGNSILAIRLISKLNKELDYNINISSILKNNTIEKVVNYLKINVDRDDIGIVKAKINKIEEQILSFAQERLWFIEKYEEGSNAYNIPMVYKLSNKAKLYILENSIKSIIARHEILRTLIKEDDDGNTYQLVLDIEKYPLEIVRNKVKDQVQLDQELSHAINYVFDLSNEYPIKVNLYEKIDITQGNNKEYFISIVIHHIAFDGWSADIFLKELEQYYNYHLDQLDNKAAKLNLPKLSLQYKDFALWQRNYLNEERLKKQIDYWKNKLSNYEILNLFTDNVRPNQITYNGNDIFFELDNATSVALRELAKELKVSLYSLILSGYYLMLRVYSNQNDIVIGTPVANRHYNQIENLIGLFTNSLALRMRIESKASIKEFIQQVGQEVVEAQAHQDLPFEKLVDELNVTKDTSRHPIFQVMFGIQGLTDGQQIDNQSDKEKSNISNLLEPYANIPSLYNNAKFDISVLIDDSQIRLKGGFNYAVNLYTEATINQFIKTYIIILKQFAKLTSNHQKQEQSKLFNLKYIDQEEYNRIVHKWNCTEEDYPRDKTIHELFEEQVKRTPDNIAIINNGIKLTYKELNERSNQLAHYLREHYGIREDRLVALCLDRNEHMLIAILGVLKAGGAYVPLDPSYPEERIRYILEDTATNIVLTNEVHKERLESIVKWLAGSKEERTKEIDNIVALETKVLAMDSKEIGEQLLNQLITNPAIKPQSTNLAYVIYTSGTTGKPKGVMIEHKAYIATIDYVRGYYFAKDKGIKTYSITNYVFDIFGLEYGVSLLSGGSISIGNNEFNFLDCTEYDFVQMTPSICDLKLDCFANTMNTKLFVGGESLSSDLLNRILSKSINIVNVYGPTETTIWSASKLYEAVGGKDIRKVSLGKPFGNEKVYVLDENLVPLPVGAIGELYIGGEGLARGYWGKHGLTAERFIANPFQTEEEKLENRNGRIYKTGDLVRWLESVELEYIGRNDFQVKVRGHRIELGEIEEVLSSYEGVKQSVVVIKEHNNIDKEGKGNKYVIGYYVSEEKLDEERILGYMRGKLPEYMIPSVLVHLERLPLTVNGKLDRQALPDAEFISVESYVAPRNELEKKLCQIWGEVLGLGKEKVGIRDDFFRLGGNSILAIRLISKLNKELNSQIKVKDIFELKSISRIVEMIGSNDNFKDDETYVPFSLANKEVVGLY